MIRLSFVGDICLGLGAWNQRRWDPWSGVREAFKASDEIIGNLECCLVDHRCNDAERNHRMAVPAAAVRHLEDLRLHATGLANNHILDCGPRGLEATREALESAGIEHFGAGPDLATAGAVRIRNVHGQRIAYLGACDLSRYFAGRRRAGVVPMRRRLLLAAVSEARTQSDLVVVHLHGDLEFTPHPSPSRQRLARALVDAGADLVIQHHPHVIQGVETYHHGLIAYSLGNFLFKVHGNRYQERYPGTRTGLIIHVDWDAGAAPAHRWRWSVEPTGITDRHATVLLEGRERTAVLSHFADLCYGLREPPVVRKAWRRRSTARLKDQLWWAYYDITKGRPARAIRDLGRCVTHSEDRAWLIGALTAGRR